MPEDTRIITTPAGVVEVSTHGSGVAPILVLHGSPGGIDAARAMSHFLLMQDNTFTTICLSRPGYLGTPLNSIESSIDHEADLLAAVLNAVINLEQRVGGGPVAYRLAVRYPDRVLAIVAIAAVSVRWVAPKPSAAESFMFGTIMGKCLLSFLSKRTSKRVIAEALKGEGSLRGEELRILADQVEADPKQRRLVLEIARTVTRTAGKRQAGWQNDVANFARIDILDLNRVCCPVLLVHGDADTDASIEHSHFAHKELQDSHLIIMARGTHLSFFAHPEASDVQQQARGWFTTPTAAPLDERKSSS